MKNSQYITPLIGKAPWLVWKGAGSHLFLEFGAKCRSSSGPVKGTYSLCISMAHWWICKESNELVNSESKDTLISKGSQILSGKRLAEVIFCNHVLKNRVLCSVRFIFDDRISLRVYMYSDRTEDELFFISGPGYFVKYDYQGKLSVKRKLNKSK